MNTIVRPLAFIGCLFTLPVVAGAATLSNKVITVEIDEAAGALTVVDRAGGRVWAPDPWLGSAGSLTFTSSGGNGWWNLSQASDISVGRLDDHSTRVQFRNRSGANRMPEWSVRTEVSIAADEATMTLRVLEVTLPQGYTAQSLRYPERHFALKTGVDRGAAVIPFWQGVIIPSTIFPMNGGRFCMWDDAQHSSEATGELKYYTWDGLTMPWFGVHDQRSAIMAVVPYDGSVRMQWIANYNNADYIQRNEFRRSPYARILALTPVWHCPSVTPETAVTYHVLPAGDHVAMAKHYRKFAQTKGLFVSLEEKAQANTDVRKLQGALYVGIYGGYPHYVNLPGMAFTFDDLDAMVRDMHDNLGLKRAFIHAWGTFSNYAPVMWPVNEDLGGVAGLKRVVDRVKGYGWLYSSYHSFVSLLDHDPDFNMDLAPRDVQGRPILRGRWKAVDEDRWVELAKACLPQEMAAIGQNADITDIAFTGEVSEGGRKLAQYLASTGLVLGTERGNEWLVPMYHMLEGMTPAYRRHPLTRYSHPAPLFNLVYHDAVTNYGKIQDPNQLVNSYTGDYYVKTLRAMLHGDGPMVFLAPYEYEGVRPYIKFAADLLGPLHESIAFDELVEHRYISPDFLVQRSRFAGGVEITVNLGSTPFRDESGLEMSPYGFRVVKGDGQVVQGRFRHHVVMDGNDIPFEPR